MGVLKAAGSFALFFLVSGATHASEQVVDPAVEATFVALNAPMDRCYETAHAEAPSLAGTVTLKLTVAADGAVPQVAVTAADLRDQEVYLCMMSAARQAHFPPPAAGTATLARTWTFPDLPPAPPPKPLVPSAPTYAGVLTKARTLANKCYAKGLAVNPRLRGGVSLEVHVAATGAVGPVKVASTTLNASAVEACIGGAFQTLVFPPQAAAEDLYLPLSFPMK